MARFKIICFDMGEHEIIKESDDVNEVIEDMQWRDPQSYFIGDERDKVGYNLKDFIRNFRDNKNELADEVTLMSKTKAVRVPNGYIVSFEYDRTKVNNIKTIEGRKYNVPEKTWFIPKEGIEQLKTLFNDLEIEEREVKDDEIEVALNGSGAFIHELNSITDENLREFASWCLDRLPKYFFEVGASSTGKYHPKFAQGKLINDYFELDGIIKNDDIHLEVIFEHKITKQYFFCKFYLVHNDNLIIVDRRDVV